MGYSGWTSETLQGENFAHVQTVDVPVATKALHGLQSDLNRLLCRIQDRTCTISAAHMTPVTSAGDGIDQRPRCGEFCVHVSDLPLHELERSDGLVELVALVDIIEGVVKGCLHDSQWTAAQH